MDLIPQPRKLSRRRGHFTVGNNCTLCLDSSCPRDTLVATRQLADDLEHFAFCRPRFSRSPAERDAGIVLEVKRGAPEQGYLLTVSVDRVLLTAGSAVGLYYGTQTLRQIVRTSGSRLPCLSIQDEPDYPARGFYHDCTRGKVPTLDTLFELVERMAHYKLNQLQLYVEHTFAFAKHTDMWQGSDPLTAEDILALDRFCWQHHVDLVPSLSTFGHFYMALRSKRKEHLNELEVEASELPFSFYDRMRHYTLDCEDADSARLVRELINDFAPLFTSNLFNICCDETFDLGKGRNADIAAQKGTGRLYMDFLKGVMDAVRAHGKVPMFWGDIIQQTPELIPEIPKDTIALNWGYSANVPSGSSRPFTDAGIPFYVCPGVSGWNQWVNNIDVASKNITRFAEQGKAYGAIGLLNTDWGDYGHINLLGNSYHGLVLGAGASWNVNGTDGGKRFDSTFSRLEFGDVTGETAGVLRQLSSEIIVTWTPISQWLDPTAHIASDQREPTSGMLESTLALSPRKLSVTYDRICELCNRLIELARVASPQDDLVYRELVCGARGAALMHAIVLAVQAATGHDTGRNDASAYRVADEIRRFERQYSELWHLRNRPSEYWRIRDVLTRAADRLDELGRP